MSFVKLKEIFQKIAIFLVVLAIFSTFSLGLVFADHEPGHDLDDEDSISDAPFTFPNPLKAEFGTVSKFIGAILSVVVQIGTPILVLMIIYSGFLFVTARGNEDKLTVAKKSFVYTVIGAAIVLGAFVIQQALEGTVNQLRGDGN